MNEYDGSQVVGIDLHRQRSVIVRQTAEGEQLSAVRIVNDPVALGLQIEKAGTNPEVVLEATYGWYWAVDALQAAGASVHLAHPLGVKGFRYRRVKNDVRDARDLADLLRMHRLPEAWIAPPPTRELRELVRYRAKLVALRSGLKAQVHSVLAKAGLLIPVSDLFGVEGRERLTKVPLGVAYAKRVISLLELIDVLDAHERRFFDQIAAELRGHPGYRAIQALPGVGPTLGAVFVAEIGDVHRFADPSHLCSWAGLTPKHHESDTVVHRGHITKQGSKLVRWAAVEAIQRQPAGSKISVDRKRIEARRGRNIAKVAAARKLLTLVFTGFATERSAPCLTRGRRREHPGGNTRAAAIRSDPRVNGVVAVLIDPACCQRTTPCPQPAGRRDDRQPRKLGPAQPPYASHWRRCTTTKQSETETELPSPVLTSLRWSGSSSRPFVLADAAGAVT
jgi:transposase